MSYLFAFVALDRHRVNSHLAQSIVQEHAGACTALPVDIANVGARQVGQALDVLGVARRDNQPLLPPGQCYQHHRSAREILLYVGDIVFTTFGVKQVTPGQVGFTPSQRDEASQATSVGAGQPHARRALDQELRQQVKDQIVATDGDDGPFDLSRIPEKFDRHRFTGVHAFREARNAHDAVSPYQRRDHTSPPRQWRGHRPVSHVPHRHTHEFVVPQGRLHLARQRGLHPRARPRRTP